MDKYTFTNSADFARFWPFFADFGQKMAIFNQFSAILATFGHN